MLVSISTVGVQVGSWLLALLVGHYAHKPLVLVAGISSQWDVWFSEVHVRLHVPAGCGSGWCTWCASAFHATRCLYISSGAGHSVSVTFGAKVSWDFCSMTARLSVVDGLGIWGDCLQQCGGPDLKPG